MISSLLSGVCAAAITAHLGGVTPPVETGEMLLNYQQLYAVVGSGTGEILAVAGRLLDFDQYGTAIEQPQGFDSSYSFNSVRANAQNMLYKSFSGAGDTTWFRFRLESNGNTNQSSGTPTAFGIYDAEQRLLCDIAKTSGLNSTVIIRIYGTTTVSGTISVSIGTTSTIFFDVKYTKSGTGATAELYSNGVLRDTVSVSDVGVRTVPATTYFYTPGFAYTGSGVKHISEVIISKTSTIGLRLSTLQPSSNGFYSDFSGTLADINNASMTDGLSTYASDERASWSPTSYGGSSGNVQAVCVSSRGGFVSGDISQFGAFLRIGGTDYEKSGFPYINSRVYQEIWSLNPDGDVPWTTSDLSSIQVGTRVLAGMPFFKNVLWMNDFRSTVNDQGPLLLTTTKGSAALVSSVQKKEGEYAISFNGTTNGYLDLAGTASIGSVANTTDVTFEAWVYITDLSHNNTIFSKRNTSSSQEFDLLVITSGQVHFTMFNSGTSLGSVQTATLLSTNTWYHIAAVRVSGVLRLFVNGVEDANSGVTLSGIPSSNSSVLRIGRHQHSGASAWLFEGYMDLIRLSYGLARYTANFVPPTSFD